LGRLRSQVDVGVVRRVRLQRAQQLVDLEPKAALGVLGFARARSRSSVGSFAAPPSPFPPPPPAYSYAAGWLLN
jgi:hypothetical protein